MDDATPTPDRSDGKSPGKSEGKSPGRSPGRSDGTVGRTLAVLDLVAAFGRPVRFAELLPVSGLPKATLYRFLQTLTNQGMLAFDAVSYTHLTLPTTPYV